MGLADRDYMRDVPEYRRVTGRETGVPDSFPRSSGRTNRSSFWSQPVGSRAAVMAAALGVLLVVVLPRLTILGRHWNFFILP